MVDEPKSDEPTLGALQELRVVRSQHFQTVFANNSRMRINATEISLTFGFVDQPPGEQAPYVEEMVTLVFTPQHTKQLAISLTEIMKLFESQYGPVSAVVQTTPLDVVK